jgi:hypothetical protein
MLARGKAAGPSLVPQIPPTSAIDDTNQPGKSDPTPKAPGSKTGPKASTAGASKIIDPETGEEKIPQEQ